MNGKTCKEVDPFTASLTQPEIEKLEINKGKLDTQLRENEMVKKELDVVGTDSTVYKLIGPTLIKQDPDEARATVAKRIEYLAGELYVCVINCSDLEGREVTP